MLVHKYLVVIVSASDFSGGIKKQCHQVYPFVKQQMMLNYQISLVVNTLPNPLHLHSHAHNINVPLLLGLIIIIAECEFLLQELVHNTARELHHVLEGLCRVSCDHDGCWCACPYVQV